MNDLRDIDELAGLASLIVQLVGAARAEGVAIGALDESAHAGRVAQTGSLLPRVDHRVRRLEALARMGGIEPSDVRAALVGKWRN